MPISNADILQRLAVVETENKQMKQDMDEIKDKLDQLLALRNKGLGAFWLATSLAGLGGVSIFYQLLGWFGFKIGG